MQDHSLYTSLCANQLHVLVMYSHHKAEHVAGLHTNKGVFRF